MAETKKKFLDLEGLGIVVTKIMGGTVHSVNGRKGAVTITKTDVALGNVTNDAQVKRSEMGKAGGVATLDTAGKVPSSQLPSYVDDVLEYDKKASFPATGETGKIYVDKATNKTYRWGGTAYVEISASIALGETSSTAYAGDKGKKNATDIAALNGAIDAHNAHLADLMTDVNSLKESAADLTPRVEAAEGEIEYLQGQVESATQKIDDIRVIKQGNVIKGARHTVASIDELTASASDVTIPYTDVNMQTMFQSPASRTIPAATSTAAGVMTAAQVKALSTAQSDITSLKNKTNALPDRMVSSIGEAYQEENRVVIDFTFKSITNGTSQDLDLPIGAATSTLAGVMTAEHVNTLNMHSDDINVLENEVNNLKTDMSAITTITTAEIDALFS